MREGDGNEEGEERKKGREVRRGTRDVKEQNSIVGERAGKVRTAHHHQRTSSLLRKLARRSWGCKKRAPRPPGARRDRVVTGPEACLQKNGTVSCAGMRIDHLAGRTETGRTGPT